MFYPDHVVVQDEAASDELCCPCQLSMQKNPPKSMSKVKMNLRRNWFLLLAAQLHLILTNSVELAQSKSTYIHAAAEEIDARHRRSLFDLRGCL